MKRSAVPRVVSSIFLLLAAAASWAAVPGVVRDVDADRMEDAWETAHGLSPASAADALLDGDGDGASNVVEFWFGTDPQNALSKPALTVGLVAGQPTLLWTGLLHKRYQLESTANLATIPWVGLGTPLLGTGAGLQFTDPVLPAASARFYRLQAIASFDRDRDGLDDWLEVAVYASDPNRASSSGTGIPDGWAVRYGLNPNTVTAAGNTDGDSAGNLAEYVRGTDPTLADPPSGDATAKLRVFTPLNR